MLECDFNLVDPDVQELFAPEADPAAEAQAAPTPAQPEPYTGSPVNVDELMHKIF